MMNSLTGGGMMTRIMVNSQPWINLLAIILEAQRNYKRCQTSDNV